MRTMSLQFTVQYSTQYSAVQYSTPQYGEARAGCQVLSVRSPAQMSGECPCPLNTAQPAAQWSVCILEACTTPHQLVQVDE